MDISVSIKSKENILKKVAHHLGDMTAVLIPVSVALSQRRTRAVTLTP